MAKCIFCEIAQKKIETKIIFEDEELIAFYDVSPQAPIHFLVIPKCHIESAAQANSGNVQLFGHIFEVIAKISGELQMQKGFRIVTNSGELGGQTVSHLHFHILGGRQLMWPPG